MSNLEKNNDYILDLGGGDSVDIKLETKNKVLDRDIIIKNYGSTGTGGIDTSDATATSVDILVGKTAYTNNQKITGVILPQVATQEGENINWNQLINMSNILQDGASVVTDGYHATYTNTSGSTGISIFFSLNSIVSGHKYYFYTVNPHVYVGGVDMYDEDSTYIYFDTILLNGWSGVSSRWYASNGFLDASADASNPRIMCTARCHSSSGYTITTGDTLSFDQFYLVDLTQMYGEGNEPTTWSDSKITWIQNYISNHPEYTLETTVNTGGENYDLTQVESDIQNGHYALLTGDEFVPTFSAETLDVTANGTYTSNSGKYINQVNVNVESIPDSNMSNLQVKTILDLLADDCSIDYTTYHSIPDGADGLLVKLTGSNTDYFPRTFILPMSRAASYTLTIPLSSTTGTNFAVTKNSSANTQLINPGSLTVSELKYIKCGILFENGIVEIETSKSVTIRPATVSAGDKTVTITPSDGYDAMAEVQAIIPFQYKSLSITPTTFDSGNVSITPDSTKILSSVTVNAPTETKSITENGSNIDVKGYGFVNVNVESQSSEPTLPTGFTAIAKGTYTFSSDMTGSSGTTDLYMKTITHNLGVVPDMILFYAPSNVAQTYSMLAMEWGNSITAWRGSTYKTNVWYHGNSTTTVTGTSCNTTYGIRDVTDTVFKIKTYSNSSSYYWRAGTYHWIAMKF